MLPGPTIVRACAGCGAPMLQFTLTSGNTFGAIFWTDGKREAPMLPDTPWLVKCKACGALSWIDELECLGELGSRGGGSRKFGKAHPYETPTLQDYLAVLARGGSDRKKERYLRLRAWWAGNDGRRERPAPPKRKPAWWKRKKPPAEEPEEKHEPPPLGEEERDNLCRLADLLSERDPDDRLMKAEVIRELGRFEEAAALLDGPPDEEREPVIAFLRSLVAESDRVVREIRLDK